MKFFAKILLTLSSIFWLLAIVIYFFIQSPFGLDYVNRWIDHYHITIGQIDHSFDKPYEIILSDVKWLDNDQQTIIEAKTLVLGLDKLFDWNQLDYLLIQDGVVTFNTEKQQLPFSGKRLQLANVSLFIKGLTGELVAEGVYGGLLSYNFSQPMLLLDSEFTFSAKRFLFDQIALTNGFIKGRIKSQRLFIDNIGADLLRGSFVGQGRRYEDGSWVFDNLQFNDIKIQTEKSLTEALSLSVFSSLPKITLNRIEMTNGEIEGNDWKASQIHTYLQNIVLQDNTWLANDSQFVFYAANLVQGEWHFIQPNIKVGLYNDEIKIDSLSAYWQKGLISTEGSWSFNSKRLQLNSLVFSGIDYVLPDNWQKMVAAKLPDWLQEIYVEQIKLTPSQLVSIDLKFPFQFTNLTFDGEQLLLAKSHQLGIWSGTGNLAADNVTINEIGLRHLSTRFLTDENRIIVADASALTDKGLIEADFKVGQLSDAMQLMSLNLQGRSISTELFNKWHLLNNSPTQFGDVKLTLEASNDFKSLEGKLILVKQGRETSYIVNNNTVE